MKKNEKRSLLWRNSYISWITAAVTGSITRTKYRSSCQTIDWLMYWRIQAGIRGWKREAKKFNKQHKKWFRKIFSTVLQSRWQSPVLNCCKDKMPILKWCLVHVSPSVWLTLHERHSDAHTPHWQGLRRNLQHWHWQTGLKRCTSSWHRVSFKCVHIHFLQENQKNVKLWTVTVWPR